MAEPATHEDDIEAVCACLEDDAAGLRMEVEDDERADTMEEAAATIRSLCKQLDEARSEWRTVGHDGLPTYQPEVTYIGINSAGFAACFTIVEPDGACWMNTGEEDICVMSELKWWRALDRPAIASALGGVDLPDGEQR
jgi:hypothetical protein